MVASGASIGKTPKIDMQHRCSLSVHDDSVSEADVLLNISFFPPGAFIQGEVVRLVGIDDPHVRDPGSSPLKTNIDVPKRERQDQDSEPAATPNKDRYFEFPSTGSSGSDDLDLSRGYLFKVKDTGPEILARSPDVQVCYEVFVLYKQH